VPFETRRPLIADIYVPMRLFVDILAHGGTTEADIRRAYPEAGRREVQVLLAYARSLPSGLAERFHLLMHDGYWAFGNFTKAKDKTGKGYWANYQLRAVRRYGGREAVRRFLANSQPQEGFGTVQELDLAEFSIEALVLQPPWSNLFTQQELDTARRRLASSSHTHGPDRSPDR
jgi:hypothetical protein